MIAGSRLNQAVQVLEKEFVPGKTPLSRFLQAWFKENRQMGSRDRKIMSSLLHQYFRCYFLLGELPVQEKLLAAQFILGGLEPLLVQELKPHWLDKATGSLPEKLAFLETEYPGFKASSILPFQEQLSSEIDFDALSHSFLEQPKLFIRIRRGFEKQVKKTLQVQNILFEEISEGCLAFENRTSLDLAAQGLQGIFEIQDFSSQQTATLFKPSAGENWWDCCAGSGGKSLLLADLVDDLHLHASDLRPSILINLRQRFADAGIPKAHIFQADILEQTNMPGENIFDAIILDAPCTGSGTWARSPDMAAAFSLSTIRSYQLRQLKMAQHVLPSLKPGGKLIYITCSVFRAENEWVTGLLEETGKLRLEENNYFTGYHLGADTLFGASFTKLEGQVYAG